MSLKSSVTHNQCTSFYLVSVHNDLPIKVKAFKKIKIVIALVTVINQKWLYNYFFSIASFPGFLGTISDTVSFLLPYPLLYHFPQSSEVLLSLSSNSLIGFLAFFSVAFYCLHFIKKKKLLVILFLFLKQYYLMSVLHLKCRVTWMTLPYDKLASYTVCLQVPHSRGPRLSRAVQPALLSHSRTFQSFPHRPRF